ncbi:MAG: S41 family peptidase [Pseudomonadota bacterium]
MIFYKAVIDVAVAAQDEHVIPFPPEAYRESRRDGRVMLPYTVQWVDDQPYVAAVADPKFSRLVGRAIVRFDTNLASDVLDVLEATIPSDGSSETFAIRRLQDFTPTQNENYFDLNYPIWFGAQSDYKIEVKGLAGTTESISLKALDWKEFSDFYRKRLKRDAPVDFRWLDNDIAYLSINSFHDWYFEEHGLDAPDHFSKIFETLGTNPDAKLVLDLRQNEGGGDISSLLLDYLLQHPFREYDAVFTRFVGQPAAARHCENADDVAFDPSWAEPSPETLFRLRPAFESLITGAAERSPRPDAFGGELIVLTSGVTGSAAAKVVSVLDRQGRAYVIGEETGGTAVGATAFGYCSLILPESGIKVDIPLVRFERHSEGEYGRGLIPDMRINAGRVPPVSENDEVLAAALTHLRKKH